MPTLSAPILPFTQMNIPAMLAAYNELAEPRGAAPLKSWHESRVDLATKLAILRTQKIVAPPVVEAPPKKRRRRRASAAKKRGTPLRSSILRLLAIVSHYERIMDGGRVSKHAAWRYPRETLLSVGLDYPAILAALRKEFPASTVSRNDLRWNACQVRHSKPGFDNCTLPQKRPHGDGKKGK